MKLLRIGFGERPKLEPRGDRQRHCLESCACGADRGRLARWLRWAATQTFDETVRFIRKSEIQAAENNGFQAAMVLEGKIAGVIGFTGVDWKNRSTCLGYWLGAENEGRGAMTAAVRAMLRTMR